MIEVPHQRVLLHPAGACGSYRRAGFAARINSMPKFVAYRTLDSPLRWNASLIGGASCASVATACRPHAFRRRKHDWNWVVHGRVERILREPGDACL